MTDRSRKVYTADELSVMGTDARPVRMEDIRPLVRQAAAQARVLATLKAEFARRRPGTDAASSIANMGWAAAESALADILAEEGLS